MTLAQLQSYWYRRTKTNSTSFPAADQVIALNNANEYALSCIRDKTDNFLPTAWTTTDLSTGTATPVFESLYHQIIALYVCWQWAIENDQRKAAGFERELQMWEEKLRDFYDMRTYRICTMTIASPGVITRKDHELNDGDRVIFSTSGALPTGLSVNTWYYVVNNDEDETFQVSSTKDGTAINTSGTQSGTHWFATDKQVQITTKQDNFR